jgi:hypothetical protein
LMVDDIAGFYNSNRSPHKRGHVFKIRGMVDV